MRKEYKVFNLIHWSLLFIKREFFKALFWAKRKLEILYELIFDWYFKNVKSQEFVFILAYKCDFLNQIYIWNCKIYYLAIMKLIISDMNKYYGVNK